jgi:hypothetical protein
MVMDARDAASRESGTMAKTLARGRAVAWGAVLLITLAGLGLRIAGALGDLWFDEIWSFALLQPLTSIDQVFWRINHDNNHFANSAYLYLVGPDVSPLLQRALSVLLGAATIVAAAAVASRGGRAAMVATALLFAVSYPMVHYGSEARGYVGLVLFTLLAVSALERVLEGRGSRWVLALAVLLGFLFHLTTAASVAVLVVWAAWRIWKREDGGFGAVNREIGGVFGPAFFAVLPLAACVMGGSLLFGFKVGGVSPFSLASFETGYGGLIVQLFGLPGWTPGWLAIAAAWVAVGLGAWLAPDRRSSLYLIGIAGLPLLMVAARLPNLEFSRYFLVSGMLLLLWTGEMIGRGVAAGGLGRVAAVALLAATLAASAGSLERFFEYGRGSYRPMVERMTREGPAAYVSNQELRTVMTVDFFASRLGREARFVPRQEWCSGRAEWLILDGEIEPSPSVRPADCAPAYDRVESSRPWSFSGVAWALYRRRD